MSKKINIRIRTKSGYETTGKITNDDFEKLVCGVTINRAKGYDDQGMDIIVDWRDSIEILDDYDHIITIYLDSIESYRMYK